MTIRLKNPSGLPCAYKLALRQPQSPEMAFIVRGRYRLAPGSPLTLVRSDEISQDLIDKTRKESEEAADQLDETRLSLGQGALTGDVFEDDDDDRIGEIVYPSDFADYKLRAEVMLRGTCHPPRANDTECEVTFAVGTWSKSLKVMGHRVWVDRTAGGAHSRAMPIGSVAVDYAHAYGGPGFDNNPIGKGHVEKVDNTDEIYQPRRSERSRVMPSQQLPNILHATGAMHEHHTPAGFGPLNASWPLRSHKLGKKYDEEWLDTRAPYFAEDMDGTYFNAAPSDQQLDRFLRGDEELTFTHLHPKKRSFSVRLPAQRIRVFVSDTEESSREITMRLDTLFADVDDGSLYLTWRGLTPVKEEDLTDMAFGLVVSEPLAEKRPAREYLAELEAFAADPVGLKDAFPEGFMEFADNAKKLENASDDELEALLEHDDGNSPPVALGKNVFGPMAPPGLEKLDGAWNRAAEQEHVDPAVMKAKVSEGVEEGVRGGGGGAVGIRVPVRKGEKPIFPIGNMFREQEKALLEMKKKLPEDAPPEASAKIDAALERIRTNPELLAADPHDKPYVEGDEPDAPGPGADLLGRDLSNLDLSGMDLSGADLQCAILDRTRLTGANLTGAKLGGARLNRADLTDANLTDVDLTSASLDRVTALRTNLSRTRLDLLRVTGCDFSQASFTEAEGMLATFTESSLVEGDFGQSRMKLCTFDTCEIAATRYTGATLEHVRFDKCEGQALVLEGAELVGTSFHECKLAETAATGVKGDGAIWYKSMLSKACFQRADLRASHFLYVEAPSADFSRANLPGARFDRAILRKASFERANLLNADLRKASVSKANFRKAILHNAQLTETAGHGVDFDGADMKGVNMQRSQITTRTGGRP